MKHFEFHITVKNGEGVEQRLIDFCKGRDNIKPVLIDLDGTGHDLMTSTRQTIEDGNYVTQAQTLIRLLKFNDFDIARVKVESDLEGTPDHAKYYFESHIRVDAVRSNDPSLRKICTEHRAHLSRNMFKDGDKLTQMITIRCQDKREFLERVDNLINALEKTYFKVGEKVEREYCVYDSNVNHDADWINK